MTSQQRSGSDAIVIGAGIVGAACARALAIAGLSVMVIDRAGAMSGTSSQGEGNLLVSDKGRGPELVLTNRSLELWRNAAAELADELGGGFPAIEFEAKGGIVVALSDDDAEQLLAFAQEQRDVGIDARVLRSDEAREREPHLNPDVRAAVEYPDDAQVQPTIAAEALLASARHHGAVVQLDDEVIASIRTSSGAIVGVRTVAGEYHADQVIVAAGPWSGEVSARLGVALPVLPRRGVLLVTTRMPHRIFHKVYDADYVGAVNSSAEAVQTSSVIESTAAGTVLVGSSRQRIGFDTRLDVRVPREIARKALRVFPFLATASVMRTYGGFRPYMPDHLPVIGADHRMPGLWHATGHEGAGIGLALGTGELIRELIAGTIPKVDALPFSPGRPSLAPHLEALS